MLQKQLHAVGESGWQAPSIGYKPVRGPLEMRQPPPPSKRPGCPEGGKKKEKVS